GIALAIGLCLILFALVGPLVINGITSSVDNSHDKHLTKQDISIRSATLHIRCREVQERNGSANIGPPCSRATRSSAFVLELRGLPAGIKLKTSDSASRGNYMADCYASDNTGDDGDVSQFVTKPSTVGASAEFTWKRIRLPEDSCLISSLI